MPTVVLAGAPHVSLKAASPPLGFTYDEVALTLDIVAPTSTLLRSTLDLSNHAPPGLIYDYTPSAFINYAPRLIDGHAFEAFVPRTAATSPTRTRATPQRARPRWETSG